MAERQSFGEFVQSQPRQSFEEFVATGPPPKGGTPQVESSIRYLTTEDYQPPPPEPGTVARFGTRYTQQTGINDLLDIIRASNRYGAPQEVAARGEKAKTALGHVVTGLRDEPARVWSEISGIGQSMLDPKQNTADMSMHMLGAIPMLGPAIQGFVQDVWAKKYPEAAADLAAIATVTKGPKVIEAAGEALPGAMQAARTAAAATAGGLKGGLTAAVKRPPYGAALIGQALGGPKGAAIAAGLAKAPSVISATIKGARTALADTAAAEAAAAQAARAAAMENVPPGVTLLSPDYFDRLRLGPGPAITPAPPTPPDASFVRSVPGMYPTGPTPLRALPAPANVIVPEAPPDPSFVRAVPAEYPPVESPLVRGAQQAGEFTPEEQARAAAILENVEPQAPPGTQPPPAAPTAAPKPAAAELAQQFEATTRPDRMLDFLKRMDPEISAAAIDNLDPSQWELVARGAGSPAGTIPTPEDIAVVRGNLAQSEGASQITAKTPDAAKAEFEQNREIRKGPATATAPTPATDLETQLADSLAGKRAAPPPEGARAPGAAEKRVEAFAQHLAADTENITPKTLADLPKSTDALLTLETLGRRLGIDGRPASLDEVQQIVDRVRQLRGEGAVAAPEPWQVSKAQLVPYSETVPRPKIPHDPSGGYTEAEINARALRNRAAETEAPDITRHPIGSWGIDSTGELMQLREYSLDDPKLIFTEPHGKNATVRKYMEWIKEGNEPPPLLGLETEKGSIKIQQGNHRAIAIRETGGDKVKVWTVITRNRPIGGGQVMGEGLTHEAAVRNALAEGKSVPPEVLADYADLAKKSTPEAPQTLRTLMEGEKAPQWHHGSKTVFQELDPEFSHPGSEHGKVAYITDNPTEAAKYGTVRSVEFTGKVFPEESALDLKLLKRVTQQLSKDNPKQASSITARLESAKTRGIKTNDIALQEIRQVLPGDFVAQQQAINNALKKLGYSARAYTEESGAKTLAVFDKQALRAQ